MFQTEEERVSYRLKPVIQIIESDKEELRFVLQDQEIPFSRAAAEQMCRALRTDEYAEHPMARVHTILNNNNTLMSWMTRTSHGCLPKQNSINPLIC